MSDVRPSSEAPSDAPSEAAEAPAPPVARASRLVPFLISLGYLVFYRLVLLVPGSAGAILVSTLASLGLLIWLAAELGREARKPGRVAVQLAIAGAAYIVLQLLLAHGNPAARALHHALPGLRDLAFVWFAASVGALLSFILRASNMIPPVAAVLALVDIWTVLLGGPVKQVMQSPSPAARAVTHALTVPLAAPRASTVGAAPMFVVGFADFLFIAFFLAALCRFVPERRVYLRTVVALVLVLGAYMVLVSYTNWSLPALLPMAIVMIALHWRHFHYDRSEAFALLYAALFIVLIAGAFWYFGRRAAQDEAAPPAVAPPAARPT